MRMGVGSLIGSLTPREQLILRLREASPGQANRRHHRDHHQLHVLSRLKGVRIPGRRWIIALH